MEIKLISWNLNFWQNGKSSDMQNQQPSFNWQYEINKKLKEFNADFILLQEIDSSKIENQGKNVFFHKLPEESWGNAIIAKQRSVDHCCLSNSYEGSSTLMYYDFKIESGRILSIVNIYGKKVRHEGFESSAPTIHHMLSDIEPYVWPNEKNYDNIIIIAGDFNATMQDNVYTNATKYKNDKPFFDRLHNLGFSNCMEEPVQTHINTNDPKKPWQLDYFFINNRYKDYITSKKVYNTEEFAKLSDHYPIEIIINV